MQEAPPIPAVLSGSGCCKQSHPHHGTSVQNYTPEHFFFFFPPGCMLKAALCSEQAGLCPQHPNPTYLMPEPWCGGQQYRGITKRSGRDRSCPNLLMRRFSFTLRGITGEGIHVGKTAWARGSAELRLSHVLQTYLWGLNIHEAPQIAKAFHRLYTQRTFEPGPALGKHFHLTQS